LTGDTCRAETVLEKLGDGTDYGAPLGFVLYYLVCSEIEQAVVAALYRALYQKTPLTTDLLIEELTNTVPLSVTRREDIDQLREMAQGRFVNVR
ncbi:MAG: hypothetical protein ACHQWV_06180, partial [Nitrospirales bacterium]